MNQAQGYVTDVQRFSLHDGPGIRTTVFMGGCNLRCAWCHNPETNHPRPHWQYKASRCVRCGCCVQACPRQARSLAASGLARDATRCTLCGRCAEVCAAEAVRVVGRYYGQGELLALLLRDKDYYGEQGGVTFSGGEPLLQAPFVAGMLRRLRAAGVHTAVDTAGCVPWQAFEAVLPHTDLFLYDIKAVDAGVHRRFTGQDNALVLENLRRLSAAGARLWVRWPLVPGVNTGGGPAAALAVLLKGMAGVERVDILTYHDYGLGKAEGLDFPAQAFAAPAEAEVEALRRALQAVGLKVDVH